MLVSVGSYCLLERVNGNSVLDGDNTILGINTFWSAQLPVSTLALILLLYKKCISRHVPLNSNLNCVEA